MANETWFDPAVRLAAQTGICEKLDRDMLVQNIPVKKEKQLLWLAALRRKDFDPPADVAVCSQHFIGGILLRLYYEYFWDLA